MADTRPINDHPDTDHHFGLVIVAGGSGTRMQSRVKKPFLELQGVTILERTLSAFAKCDWLQEKVLVLPEAERQWLGFDGEGSPEGLELREKLKSLGISTCVVGGQRRQDSVLNGLNALSDEIDRVLVHDGVRPFIAPATIHQVASALSDSLAAVPGVAVKDTIKVVQSDGSVKETLDRGALRAIQTPQAAHRILLQEAMESRRDQNFSDEMSVLEDAGISPFVG